MAKENKKDDSQNLPACVTEFISEVIRKMRYRRKVRLDVKAELETHFEDELQSCKTDEEKIKKARQLLTDFGDVKLLAILLRRAKKRCRPLWRTMVARSFQALGVLILCFIFYCVYLSLGQPNISVNYVREMTNLTRPVVDENQNAAPLYQKAFSLYRQPPDVEQKSKPVFADDAKLLRAIDSKRWIDELTEEELVSLETWISSNSEAIELFEQATEKPHCWWQREASSEFLFSVLMPELSDMKNFSRLLSWRAVLKAHSDSIEEAFDDLLVCYRAGGHLRGPRTLIEQLVGWAIQGKSVGTAFIILQHQQVEGSSLTNFQSNLEKLMVEQIYTPDYTMERYTALDFIQRCYTDDGDGSGHMIPGRLSIISTSGTDILDDTGSPVLDYGKFLALSLISVDRDELRELFENYYDKIQGCAHKTPWQLHQENIDFENIYNWSRLKQIRYWPAMVFMPGLGRINQIAYRSKVGTEALLATIGLFRYKQDTGEYPQDLNELVTAGYLSELPIDSFSDKPLVYKREGDDFILYSFGENCRDDGGVYSTNEHGRLLEWGGEGDRVFWPLSEN